MSLTEVKSVIENFVQNDENDLLTIKGNWGVGKTYFWQNTIKNASKRGEIAHEYYSYVSLFGIDSLEALKNSIFANKIRAISVGRDSFTSASALYSDVKKFFKRSEQSPYLRKFSGGLGSEIAFFTVRKSIICFDDIERKSDSISLKDILGLASFLKEQRKCKIVFILNVGTLSEEDLKEFQKYNEKVVDRELEFAPTPDETFSYIFDENHLYFDLIKFSCTTLEIRNIRILQRIKRFIEDLIPYLKNVEKDVSKQVIRSIILFVWSYYNKDSNTISLEFIESFRSSEYYYREITKKKEPPKETQKKYTLLSKYNYYQTDEVDKHLMSFVRKGYLENGFQKELKLKNDENLAHKGRESYKDVWKLHRTSLDLNENEFIAKLVFAFRSQEKYLSFSDLCEVTNLLRRFERDNLANELIDEYLPEKANHEEINIMKKTGRLKEYENDKYLMKKLNEMQKPTQQFNFVEVIDELDRTGYLENDMLKFLASSEIEEYYNYLKSEESGEFYLPSKLLLDFGANSTEQHQAILNKTKEALRKIAKESRINRIRISDWLKIDVEES